VLPKCCLKLSSQSRGSQEDAWDPGVSLLPFGRLLLDRSWRAGAERQAICGEAEGLRARDATRTGRCGLTVPTTLLISDVVNRDTNAAYASTPPKADQALITAPWGRCTDADAPALSARGRRHRPHREWLQHQYGNLEGRRHATASSCPDLARLWSARQPPPTTTMPCRPRPHTTDADPERTVGRCACRRRLRYLEAA
jgi:hypothetical protein